MNPLKNPVMLFKDAGIPERTRLGIWFVPLVTDVPFPRPRLEERPVPNGGWLCELGVSGPSVLVLGGDMEVDVGSKVLLIQEAELALEREETEFLGWCCCWDCCVCCWVAEL